MPFAVQWIGQLPANGGHAQRSNLEILGLTFFPVIDTLRIASSSLGDFSHLTLFPHGRTANVQGFARTT